MSRYACSVHGRCEVDEHGEFIDLETCQQGCIALPLPVTELLYQSFGYSPEEALGFAPSDRVEVVHNLTNIEVPPEDSWNILSGLANEDLTELVRYPIIYPYLAEHFYPPDLVEALGEEATFPALEELQRLGFPPVDEILNNMFERASLEDIIRYFSKYQLPEDYTLPEEVIERYDVSEYLIHHRPDMVVEMEDFVYHAVTDPRHEPLVSLLDEAGILTEITVSYAASVPGNFEMVQSLMDRFPGVFPDLNWAIGSGDAQMLTFVFQGPRPTDETLNNTLRQLLDEEVVRRDIINLLLQQYPDFRLGVTRTTALAVIKRVPEIIAISTPQVIAQLLSWWVESTEQRDNLLFLLNNVSESIRVVTLQVELTPEILLERMTRQTRNRRQSI